MFGGFDVSVEAPVSSGNFDRPPRELEESIRETCGVSFYEVNSREVEEYLFFESSLCGFLVRRTRNSAIDPGPGQDLVH